MAICASKADVNEIVVGGLNRSYRPLKSKDTDPQGYGELVVCLVDDVHALRLERHDLLAGMARFRAGWQNQRWPSFGELRPFLMPAKKGPAFAEARDHKPSAAEAAEAHAIAVLATTPGQRVLAAGAGVEAWAGQGKCGRLPQRVPRRQTD